MAIINFFYVKNAECDFCRKTKQILTQANDAYICDKCACEINKHARANARKLIKDAENE